MSKTVDTSKITAAILAGGLGTRLHSIVKNKPKVLAEFHGRPFLTYLLDQLDEFNLGNVVLCTGYMADEIYNKLGDSYKSLKLIHSREYKPLGTGGALRFALPHINTNPVLVMNGDSYCEVNLNSFMLWHETKRPKASILLTHMKDSKRFGTVKINKVGKVFKFEEKIEKNLNCWINAGIYLMNQSLLTSIPQNKFVSLEKDMFPQWINEGIYGYRYKGRFIDIGTPKDYSSAEKFFMEKISM